jgi:hypothetical protein
MTTRRGNQDGVGRESRESRYVVRPHASKFRPGVDLLKLDQIVDDLDTEDFVAESRR